MLPDLLSRDLDVLICGTAAGTASALRGHYYAGPGNRFWTLLAETGLTPRRLAPDEDSQLVGFGLGLTDLAKGVAGMDHQIPQAAFLPARLRRLVGQWRPRRLAFTSLTAARLALADKSISAGRIAGMAGFDGIGLWALPSPSGAARGSFSAAPWHDLAEDVRHAGSGGAR